jgi:hypothetical protein
MGRVYEEAARHFDKRPRRSHEALGDISYQAYARESSYVSNSDRGVSASCIKRLCLGREMEETSEEELGADSTAI